MLPGGQQGGIELRVHGEFLRSHHVHLGHAVDHRDALRHQRLGVLVHIGERQGGGVSDRLRMGWSAGFTLRKVGGRAGYSADGAGSRDRGLHVLSGGIE